MANRKPLLILGALVALALALPVGWYLLSPLWINVMVDEALPTAQLPTVMSTSAASAMPAASLTSVPAAASQTPAAATPDMARATAAMVTAMAATPHVVDDPMPTREPANQRVVAQGDFYEVVHNGSGQAAVFELADGSRLLRLDNFMVLNGPELHVYLAPIDPVPYSVGIDLEGAVDLGRLKGNVGSQNYTLPAGLDLAQFKSVVIWCRPFRVPFIAAPLGNPG